MNLKKLQKELAELQSDDNPQGIEDIYNFYKEHWDELIDEIESLRDEIDGLESEIYNLQLEINDDD